VPGGSALAVPLDIRLTFDSLPSSRGFTFVASGSHAGVAESAALTPVHDNTAYRDHIFEWSPGGTWQLYRDGLRVTSGSGGGVLAASRILFGDGTGGANTRGDIAAFRFTQDLATAAMPSTWGRVESRYR
jgi:hypothetical protein